MHNDHPFAIVHVGTRWLVCRVVAYSGDIPILAETAQEFDAIEAAQAFIDNARGREHA